MAATRCPINAKLEITCVLESQFVVLKCNRRTGKHATADATTGVCTSLASSRNRELLGCTSRPHPNSRVAVSNWIFVDEIPKLFTFTGECRQ